MAFSFMTQFNRVSMAVAGNRRIMGQYGLSPVQMGQVYWHVPAHRIRRTAPVGG